MRDIPADGARIRAVLDSLIRAKGLERFARFLTTGEGIELADDLEEYSGKVIDSTGHHFSFWMGAGEDGSPTLTIWRETRPAKRWMNSAEYRRARRAVGLE